MEANLNNKLFCEATLKGGSLHGKAKINLSLYTACFGIYNSWIQIPGYSDLEPETEEDSSTTTHEPISVQL